MNLNLIELDECTSREGNTASWSEIAEAEPSEQVLIPPGGKTFITVTCDARYVTWGIWSEFIWRIFLNISFEVSALIYLGYMLLKVYTDSFDVTKSNEKALVQVLP